MGSVYWPGLRTDDTYHGKPDRQAARPWLATTNQSGADRLPGPGRGKPAAGSATAAGH